MKRMIAMVAVMLCVTMAAQAIPAVYAEITQPTATTWKLWLTQCDWTGSTAGLTPSGFGIAGFAVDVQGVTTASKATPPTVTLFNDDDPPTAIGTVGFINGPGSAVVSGGVAQAFAGQDTTIPEVLTYGFGVTAGSYTAPGTWTAAPYSWLAPGAPGSASPGVVVFSGKRAAGQDVTIRWDAPGTPLDQARNKANVFLAGTGQNTFSVPVVPEPATLALLVLGGLAALRRR